MEVPAVGIVLLLEYGHDAVLILWYWLELLECLGGRFEQAVADIQHDDLKIVVFCELFHLFMEARRPCLDGFSRYFAATVDEVSRKARLVLQLLGNAVGDDPVKAFVAESDMVQEGLVMENTVMEKDKDYEPYIRVDVWY